MRLVALLAVRNEQRYMTRCLEHLFRQGVETCVIDNESTDETLAIAERYRERGVFRIETFPYAGFFDWKGILRRKERLAEEIDADWFIHHDADEIREAPPWATSLKDGVEYVDGLGYNAVNFDEFVFVPAADGSECECGDYVSELTYYYFYQPGEHYRINAWKKGTSRVDLASSGGHRAQFAGRRIFPDSFILRHYIILGRKHAASKYGRVYSSQEVLEDGWHAWRPHYEDGMLCLPRRAELKCLGHDRGWDRSAPLRRHPFIKAFPQTGAQRCEAVSAAAAPPVPRSSS